MLFRFFYADSFFLKKHCTIFKETVKVTPPVGNFVLRLRSV